MNTFKIKVAFIVTLILIPIIGCTQTLPSWSQIKTTPNIAAMLLLRPTAHGTQVMVDGYYTIGDGGGGVFYWHSTSTATADDGLVFAGTGITTGRWIRLRNSSPEFDVRWWGALPNTSCATQLQKAINATVGQGTLRFPSGTFTIATGLTAPVVGSTSKALYWVGVGGKRVGAIGNTVLKYTGASGTALLDLTQGVANDVTTVNISGITFDGESPAAGQIGILTSDFRTSKLSECFIIRFAYGFKCDTSVSGGYAYYSAFNNVSFFTCEYGLWWKGNWNSTRLEGCLFNFCTVGIYIESGDTGPTFDGCYFEGNVSYCIDLRSTDRLVIKDSYFEASDTLILFAPGNIQDGLSSVKIDGCFFKGGFLGSPVTTVLDVYSTPGEVATQTGTLVTFSNNVFENWDTPTMTLITSLSGSEVSLKQGLLIGNTYRRPNMMDLRYQGSSGALQRINRVADGPSNVWMIGESLSPATSAYLATGTQQQEFVGMLRFHHDSQTFQGLASTTTGWENMP